MRTQPIFSRAKVVLRQSFVLDASACGLAICQGSATDVDIADDFGWSKGTVANVRNRANGLTLWSAMEAANATGGEFLRPLLALIGKDIVDIAPVDATPDVCKLAPIARAVAAVAECTAPGSCGGTKISRSELLANEGAIRDLALVAAELNQALDAALGVGVK